MSERARAGTAGLEASDVRVRFEGLTAVDAVDLHLDAGEILGLIGPNGAGKTTLVNVLSGFQRPTEGRVLLDGRDITGWPAHRRARVGLSRTFQSTRLFAGLSVRENLEVSSISVNIPPKEARALATQIMRSMDLGARASQPAGSLPYGEERRVAIARALASRPRFLLLDEPAAGLNEDETDALAASLTNIHEALGCALLVIEHDVGFIMRLCHRIHVLDHGATIAVGTPEGVRTNPDVLRAYLGEPAELDAQG